MIHLTYSNRTEALLDSLALDLQQAREQGRSPFEPVRVVVPNRNVETWLKHGLARRLGIAANLEVLLLRRFVGGVIQESLAREGPTPRLVDGPILQDLLLTLFLDESYLEQEELGRIRSYLHAAGDAQDAVDRRRLQLATELARLFEEYGFSRPELLNEWPRQPLLQGTAYAESERWQRRLWLDLFGEGGLAERREGETLIHLPQVLGRLEGLELEKGDSIHLFGVSYFATAFHKLLAWIGAKSELHVYTLNPCMEFWEDVEAGHAARARLPKRETGRGEDALFDEEDPFHLEQDDTPALALWGRPGRETIRLMNALTDCDFRASFHEVEAQPTLLQQFQQDILVREPRRDAPPEDFDFSGDVSVQILPAPGLRRECEAIAEEIWQLVHRDANRGGDREPLRFNEIAVLVAGSDPQPYFTHLASVFEETYQIPFNRSGSTFVSESRIAEAVELLLELPKGKFSRAQVLAFLTHPNVIAAHPEADPAAWASYCERLGIARGADHRDLADSYVEGDFLSWAQGFRRMALGSFLSGDEVFEVAENRYLPETLPPDAVSSFGLLASRVLSLLDGARQEVQTTAAWGSFFAEAAEELILPQSAAEGRELDTCLRSLRSIGELELDGREIAYGLASELAQQALGGVSGSRGQYLAGGVVVSTLQPMRAIPFRHIFIAGLGQGRFPSAMRRNVLDLRLARPRVGDISDREGDQYMFLEALLCARHRLYLSYVAREQLTGVELLPSPPLVELERMLVKGYGAGSLRRSIPLRRFEAPGAFAAPQVRREAEAAKLRDELRLALGGEEGEGKLPELGALLDGLSPEGRSYLVELLGLEERGEELPEPAPEAAPASIEVLEADEARREKGEKEEDVLPISRSMLRRFLEDPLQASASFLLGLREEVEDPAAFEEEALQVDRLPKSSLLRESFLGGVRALQAAGGGGDQAALEARIAEAYRAQLQRGQLEGRLPVGFFGAAEEAKHLKEMEEWTRRLVGIWSESGDHGLEVLRFGKAREDREGETVLDGLRFELDLGERRQLVEVVGSSEPLVQGRGGSLLLRTRKAGQIDDTHCFALRAFLDHLLLAASGARDEGAHHMAFFCMPRAPKPIRFRAVAAEEARAYLQALAEDLCSRSHDYFLPFRAVSDCRADEKKRYTEVLQDLQYDERFKSYGAVRDGKSYRLLSEEESRELDERRFGLFYRLMGKEEG